MGADAGNVPETVDRLFARAVAAAPTRPLLTWYDDGTGERVELSGTTLENWVAKTANLLVDGCGLGPGERAAVLLPPHWQTAAVLLGCWSAGLTVTTDDQPADVLFAPAAAADTATGGSAAAGDSAAGIRAAASAADRFALGFAPLGAPLREVPPGFVDYVAEVRGHGDAFTPYHPVEPGDAASDGPAALTHGGLCAAARERAADLGIDPGARVLVDAAAHPDPLDWLLAPLAAGGSVVLCASPDPGRLPARVAAEQVTVTLTAG